MTERETSCGTCLVLRNENDNLRNLQDCVSNMKKYIEAFQIMYKDLDPIPNNICTLLLTTLTTSLDMTPVSTKSTSKSSEDPAKKKPRLDLNQTKTSSSNTNNSDDDVSIIDVTGENSTSEHTAHVPSANTNYVEMTIDSLTPSMESTTKTIGGQKNENNSRKRKLNDSDPIPEYNEPEPQEDSTTLRRKILTRSQTRNQPLNTSEEEDEDDEEEQYLRNQLKSVRSPPVLINPNLRKVKLDVDYNPIKKEIDILAENEETVDDSIVSTSIPMTATDKGLVHLTESSPDDSTSVVSSTIDGHVPSGMQGVGPIVRDEENVDAKPILPPGYTGWINIKYDEITKKYRLYKDLSWKVPSGNSLLDLTKFMTSEELLPTSIKGFCFYLDWMYKLEPELEDFVHLHGDKIKNVGLYGHIYDDSSFEVEAIQKIFFKNLPNLESLQLSMYNYDWISASTPNAVSSSSVSLPELSNFKYLRVDHCCNNYRLLPDILRAAPNLLVYFASSPLSYRDHHIVRVLTETGKLGTLKCGSLEFHDDELKFIERLADSKPKLRKLFIQIPYAKNRITASSWVKAKMMYSKLLDTNKDTLKSIVVNASTIFSDFKFFQQLEWPKLDKVHFLSVQVLSHPGCLRSQFPRQIQTIFPNLKTVEIKLTTMDCSGQDIPFSNPFLGVSTSVQSVRFLAHGVRKETSLQSPPPKNLVKMLKRTFANAKFEY